MLVNMERFWNNVQDALDDLMVVLGKMPEAKQNVELRKQLVKLTKLRNVYKREMNSKGVKKPEVNNHFSGKVS